jgi:hypothetical protein
MKRSVTVILSLVAVAVGFGVISGSRTLESACTLNAQTGGGACVSSLPFYALGIALITTGAVTTVVALSTLIRAMHRRSTHELTAISTLHPREVESLREVA